MYYDTTHETTDKQVLYEKINSQQDSDILAIFRKRWDSILSVPEVEDILEAQGKTMLRTSVGRSLHTLTTKGFLIKTQHKVMGRYGRLVYTWALKPDRETQLKFA